MNWKFNPTLYTLEEQKKMNEWADEIYDLQMTLDDIPEKYRQAINWVLNSN